jgi:uncharacterized membrane protein
MTAMSDLTDDRDPDADAGDARRVATQRGLEWWTEAWALFTRNPLMWVALGLILMVGYGVVGMVPLLGAVATTVAAPAFIASWLMAARKVDQGGALEVVDLFGAFKEPHLTPLLLQGAALLGAVIVIVLAAAMVGFGAMFGAMGGGVRHGGGMLAAASAGLFALLLLLGLGTLITAALWFAPALVVYRGLPAVEALRESFGASIKNLVPFLVFGLIYLVAAIVASIPFALGWLVLVPVSLLAAYVSFKDVFGP